MKALTICQPYADLICLPDDDHRAKRVENRRWATKYRGPLLIHAGKSRDYLLAGDIDGVECDLAYGLPLAGMQFGSLVGRADLVDCFYLEHWETQMFSPRSEMKIPLDALRRFPWLAYHLHVEGPYCLVLADVERFATPIPYRGALGLFEVDKSILQGVIA